MSRSSCKTAELEAQQLEKNSVLPKEKLKSLTKRLHGLLRLLDTIVKKKASMG